MGVFFFKKKKENMSVIAGHHVPRSNDQRQYDTPSVPINIAPDSEGHIHEMSRLKDYEVIEKLGQGTFGVVQKAKSKKDGLLVAIKQLINHSAKEGFPITAMREITILKQLNHQNILTIQDMIFEEPKMSNRTDIITMRGSFYTVTPYMSSDLVGLLENPKIKLELGQIKCIMQQLLKGIQYVHNQKFLHRDIKAANILIGHDGVLKIADFGLARIYHGNVPRLGMGPGGGEKAYTGLVVTRWYRPPEILLGERKYTTAVDLWGIGCVFAELFTGKPILVGKSDSHQAQIVFELVGSPLTWTDAAKLPNKNEYSCGLACKRSLEAKFASIMPTEAIDLLSGLLTLDPFKRLNALDALNHKFFSTDPLPLLPTQMPKFEESHEIDKERFKKLKDKEQAVSELKPPTEIRYDNHSESRYNADHSTFGGGVGGKETSFSSGKSDYIDHYEPRARRDHYEPRIRNDNKDSNDVRGEFELATRQEQRRRDIQNRLDAGGMDTYIPKTTTAKLREHSGTESLLKKYDNYQPINVSKGSKSPSPSKLLSISQSKADLISKPSAPKVASRESSLERKQVSNGIRTTTDVEPPRARARGPTDMFGRPLTSNSTQAQPTRNKSVERPKDLEKPTNGVTEDRNKKPVLEEKKEVVKPNLAIPKIKKSSSLVLLLSRSSTTPVISNPSKVTKRAASSVTPPVLPKKPKISKTSSESEVSDLEEDSDFTGENATVFERFMALEQLQKSPVYKRIINEKMRFEKLSGGHKSM